MSLRDLQMDLQSSYNFNSAIYTTFLPNLQVEIGPCRDKVMWTGVDQAWDKLHTKTHLRSNINLTKFLTPFLGDLWTSKTFVMND